jgi:hypothetical protein
MHIQVAARFARYHHELAAEILTAEPSVDQYELSMIAQYGS